MEEVASKSPTQRYPLAIPVMGIGEDSIFVLFAPQSCVRITSLFITGPVRAMT